MNRIYSKSMQSFMMFCTRRAVKEKQNLNALEKPILPVLTRTIK